MRVRKIAGLSESHQPTNQLGTLRLIQIACEAFNTNHQGPTMKISQIALVLTALVAAPMGGAFAPAPKVVVRSFDAFGFEGSR